MKEAEADVRHERHNENEERINKRQEDAIETQTIEGIDRTGGWRCLRLNAILRFLVSRDEEEGLSFDTT